MSATFAVESNGTRKIPPTSSHMDRTAVRHRPLSPAFRTHYLQRAPTATLVSLHARCRTPSPRRHSPARQRLRPSHPLSRCYLRSQRQRSLRLSSFTAPLLPLERMSPLRSTASAPGNLTHLNPCGRPRPASHSASLCWDRCPWPTRLALISWPLPCPCRTNHSFRISPVPGRCSFRICTAMSNLRGLSHQEDPTNLNLSLLCRPPLWWALGCWAPFCHAHSRPLV